MGKGQVTMDSWCKGDILLHNGNTYNDVVVFVVAKIMLREGYTSADIDNDVLKLPSGSNARYRNGMAMDMINSNTFWKPFTESECA